MSLYIMCIVPHIMFHWKYMKCYFTHDKKYNQRLSLGLFRQKCVGKYKIYIGYATAEYPRHTDFKYSIHQDFSLITKHLVVDPPISRLWYLWILPLDQYSRCSWCGNNLWNHALWAVRVSFVVFYFRGWKQRTSYHHIQCGSGITQSIFSSIFRRETP